ncbi:MAG: DUF1893 domain-containing protein [Bacteroidales bacterium]|nr:DUF1893 domain-containing protein [Bacteroidales bacterium]
MISLSLLKERLLDSGCSLVVYSPMTSQVSTYHSRGIADLYELYTSCPEILQGASIADKVVGKGAAALMILGGVRVVYAQVVSQSAKKLLQEAGVEISFDTVADYIINRQATGMCPVEKLCSQAITAEECLPLIQNFITQSSC